MMLNVLTKQYQVPLKGPPGTEFNVSFLLFSFSLPLSLSLSLVHPPETSMLSKMQVNNKEDETR
jgi:hypothetical protein